MTPFEKQRALETLSAFTPANYRRQRWLAIQGARKAGATWDEVGEALDTTASGASRMNKNDRPSRAPAN